MRVDSDHCSGVVVARRSTMAAIQGEKVRVTGKSRDELQAAIALLRQQKLDVPLQFDNFRD